MNRFRHFILFLFLSLSFKISAQDFNDDAAIWINIYLEKKINSKIDLHLNQQNRINNNISQYGMGYGDFGLTFNFTKNIKLLCDYVFIQRRRIDPTYSTRHQAYLALMLRQKAGRFSFVYRNMVQLQVKDVLSSYDGYLPVYYERNKLTVKYEINKRFTGYIAEELYLPFNQKRSKGLDRTRSFAGLFYKLTKHDELELYFLYQYQLNAFNRTNRDFIYGIGFSHQF